MNGAEHGTRRARRGPLLLVAAVTVAALAAVALAPPIAQDPAYHRFADGRRLLGLDHFWNVASSLAFTLAGLWGLWLQLRRRARGAEVPLAEWLFAFAVLLIGPGSAWYHLDPTTESLFWDRLAMAVAFMALFAAVLGETVAPAWRRHGLAPLLLLGVGSVLYWRLTERAGAGDLRPYALVQFLPPLLMVLLLALQGSRRYHAPSIWQALACYALAKAAELGDGVVMQATDVVSGHTLKHLLAAAACALILRAFAGTTGHTARG